MARKRRNKGQRRTPAEKEPTEAEVAAEIVKAHAAYERVKWPLEPTKALPGTKQKIEVMRLRVAEGLHPHHPFDARRIWKV